MAMTLAELRAHTRTALLRDEAEPYLWTDAELDRYLNEGYRLFAIRTHCFVSHDAEFCTFETAQGEYVYALDSRIVQVNELYVVTGDAPPNRQLLVDHTRRQQPYYTFTGKPNCYVMQVAAHHVRLSPVPDDVYTIEMVCAHKPIEQLTSDGVVCALPEEYELALCDYAAHRALRNNDPEKANMASSKDFFAEWERQVRDAKRDFAVKRAGADAQARNNWTGKVTRRTF